jgi:hypothetical protein
MTGIGQRRVLAGLSTIGAIEGEPPDVAIRKQTLVLSAALITALATVWVVTYAALGLFLAAAIPFAYRSVSIANLLCSPGRSGTGSSARANFRFSWSCRSSSR